MKKLLVVLFLLAAAAAAYVTFNRPTATVRAAWNGRAVQAVPGSVIVLAEFDMDLKSEVGGRVVESALTVGSSFSEGDFLVQIDSSDLELEIERIQGEYEAAKSKIELGSTVALELETARERLAVDKENMDSGNFSPSEYRIRERAVQQIENKLKNEQVSNDLLLANYRNTLALKRRELAKMRITAPFECVVSEVYARPGDLIGGGAPIALLISTSRTVEARISEENFSNISLGQRLYGAGAGLRLGWLLAIQQVPQALGDALFSITEDRNTFLLLLMLFILLIGCVVEGVPAKLILVPMLLPVIDAYGIDRVHFGIIFLAAMEMGFLCPPAGMNIYFSSSMFGKSIRYVAVSVLPALAAIFVGTVIIAWWPSVATWLPSVLGH